MSDHYRDCCLGLKEVVKQRGVHFKLSISSHHFNAGAIHAVVGPNGSGKTTLLNLLSLLDEPARGSMLFWGQPVRPASPDAVFVRRRMAYVMQDPYLFRGSVLDNLAYGLCLRGVPGAHVAQRAAICLERVGLKGFEQRQAAKLSGGETKRVAIARALVLDPEVLLLDEPTANVDRSRVKLIEDEIRRANAERGATVILTTHDLDQARRMTSRIASIVAGRITTVAPDNVFPCEIVREPDGARAHLAVGLALHVVSAREGPAHVAIDPSDIIVSLQPIDSSARNCLSGRVARVTFDDGGVRLEVDAGTVFHVLVTKASRDRMGLAPGVEVFLTFKASSVHVL